MTSFRVIKIEEKGVDDEYKELVKALFSIHPDVGKAVALWYFEIPGIVELQGDIDIVAIRRVLDDFCDGYDVQLGSERWMKKNKIFVKAPQEGFQFFRSELLFKRLKDVNINFSRDMAHYQVNHEAPTTWAALTPEEKAPYMQKEAEDKARYDREMAE